MNNWENEQYDLNEVFLKSAKVQQYFYRPAAFPAAKSTMSMQWRVKIPLNAKNIFKNTSEFCGTVKSTSRSGL